MPEIVLCSSGTFCDQGSLAPSLDRFRFRSTIGALSSPNLRSLCSCTPPGCGRLVCPVTGGIVAALLDPRLISGSPPGCAVQDYSALLSYPCQQIVRCRGAAERCAIQRRWKPCSRLDGCQSHSARCGKMSRLQWPLWDAGNHANQIRVRMPPGVAARIATATVANRSPFSAAPLACRLLSSPCHSDRVVRPQFQSLGSERVVDDGCPGQGPDAICPST